MQSRAMILRRIIAHFRKQEWTAIGIDFLIVVVGVFVGMQVTNWNEDAADRRRGAEYVERLSLEMESDLATRRGEVAYFSAVLDGVLRADALLADPRASSEALIVNVYRATEITNTPSTRATWDEIVSSGDIGLLPREAVGDIAAYYARDSSQFVGDILQRTDYRRRVREIIPLQIQMAIRAGCSDVRNEMGQIVGFVEQCVMDVDAAAFDRTASALRADGQVRALLQYQYSNAFIARANISADVAILERGLNALRPDRQSAAP
jgi:hypothetical protein